MHGQNSPFSPMKNMLNIPNILINSYNFMKLNISIIYDKSKM